jgi:Ca2+-binding EF-hand superfamily protein
MQNPDYLLHEIEELFDRCDEDGDHLIGLDEFKGLMLEMGDLGNDTSLRVAFSAVDANRDGHISFGELRTWWKSRHAARRVPASGS